MRMGAVIIDEIISTITPSVAFSGPAKPAILIGETNAKNNAHILGSNNNNAVQMNSDNDADFTREFEVRAPKPIKITSTRKIAHKGDER